MSNSVINWGKGAVLASCVLAVVLGIFLAGTTENVEGVISTVSLLGVMFGNSKVVCNSHGDITAIPFSGGASTFGVISFIFLVLAVICVIISFFQKGIATGWIALILMLIAGICILFITSSGSDLIYNGSGINFVDFYKNSETGVGVYVYFVFCLLGALLLSVYGVKEYKDYEDEYAGRHHHRHHHGHHGHHHRHHH